MESITLTDHTHHFDLEVNGRIYSLPYGAMTVYQAGSQLFLTPSVPYVERVVIEYGTDALNVDGTTSFANIDAAREAIATTIYKHA